ncbi:alpha/beta hydrolase fold domain-containing protein [Streptomyces sp. NPDC102279]|uniref:alpha/beta hydrolase fold domain-containing protein n=1 Tax=Streptomyces sp. NPDC102279 TaxID=3366153 RepID=UPI0037F92815
MASDAVLGAGQFWASIPEITDVDKGRAAIDRLLIGISGAADIEVGECVDLGDFTGEWITSRAPTTAGSSTTSMVGGLRPFGGHPPRPLSPPQQDGEGAPVRRQHRLAAENPYPLSSRTWSRHSGLIEQGVAPRRTVVVGASAGGVLTAALSLTLRDAGEQSSRRGGHHLGLCRLAREE